jgi:D-3-phosphoglycerate dehydrogenase/C-terminal binding protein
MSKPYKAVITDLITDRLEPEKRILGDLADVEALDAHSEDELVGRIEDADAIMLYHNLRLSRKTIQRLNGCKLIVRCGVGYDNVDRVCARDCGIPVANVPDYGTEEVADSAVGLMLALSRGAKALGMDVAFYDPYKDDGYDKALGIRRVEELDELLAQAFVLSLHCPLTDETSHMIDSQAMAKIPAGSYLINTARGAVVDTSAIPAAIESGQLAGAGIDVLEHEPPAEDDLLIAAWRDINHPAYHRVLINPHSAFYCEEGLMEMRIKGAEACRRALCGQPVRNVVNGV